MASHSCEVIEVVSQLVPVDVATAPANDRVPVEVIQTTTSNTSIGLAPMGQMLNEVTPAHLVGWKDFVAERAGWPGRYVHTPTG